MGGGRREHVQCTKMSLGNTTIYTGYIHFKENLGLERLLSSEEHLLLLQRTRNPHGGCSQPPVPSVPWDPTPSSGLHRHCMHMVHIPTSRNIEIHIK